MAATLKDCHFKDIECSKYQFIFASAEEVLAKPCLSLMRKKQPHCFVKTCRFHIKQIIAGKPWSTVVCLLQRIICLLQSIICDGRNIIRWINGSYTQGLSFGKYRVQQISAHICDCGRALQKPLLFCLKKRNCSLFHSLAQRVFVSVRRQCFQLLK